MTQPWDPSVTPPASGARGYRVNKAGTTYTFAHDRWITGVLVACLGLISVILGAVIASPAGPHIGVLGKAGVIAAIVVPIALFWNRMARTGVQVSVGKVTVRGWRTRTVDIGEIRDITLEAESNSQSTYWVPRMQLANGEGIPLRGLSCGPAGRPPVPWRLASLDTFQSLIGVGHVPGADDVPDAFDGDGPVGPSPGPDAAGVPGDGPPAWTKGRRVSPPAGFYRDPGGQPGVRFWGGGQWSPLFPADVAKKPPGEFPGTPTAPLPASDEIWGYAASQARKARNQSAAFAAGAVVVVVLLVGNLLSGTTQLPYLGLILAFRAFSAWRVWRSWTRLDRAARAEPSLGSLTI